ncbi:MAG: hypothetical protein HXY46_10965 [Syntrophaceae bacterium]|nr:hypothetical protein [Syntrophaceae bacterium]
MTPIGVIIATPDGKLTQIKEAPQNPIQSIGAKEHLLKNLDTLQKFSEDGKGFEQIRKKGEEFLRKKKLLCQ